jgi:hypothetical protein
MPDGLGDPDLVAGLRERGRVANGTRRATRNRTSLGDPRSDVAVRSTGHERLPYLSRMCSFMASVVAHLTRVRPGAEGASDQDRLGPGRIRPSRRTAPAMCSAPPGKVGPVADVEFADQIDQLDSLTSSTSGTSPRWSSSRTGGAVADVGGADQLDARVVGQPVGFRRTRMLRAEARPGVGQAGGCCGHRWLLGHHPIALARSRRWLEV